MPQPRRVLRLNRDTRALSWAYLKKSLRSADYGEGALHHRLPVKITCASRLLTFFRQNSDPEEDNLLKRGPRRNYLVDFGRARFLSRTPGPPPFSSMNSTPAASNARRIARSLAAVIEVSRSASSARRIVRKLTADWRERSSAVHLMSARAALI